MSPVKRKRVEGRSKVEAKVLVGERISWGNVVRRERKREGRGVGRQNKGKGKNDVEGWIFEGVRIWEGELMMTGERGDVEGRENRRR